MDRWLANHALQAQAKHLSVTGVLVDAQGSILGFYTLASGQVDFGDLPPEVVRELHRRTLPVAALAWLGVARVAQGKGPGRLLVARALRDCHDAGKTFPFVAVVLDCVSERAREFYRQWDFHEVPGHPFKRFVSAARLQKMMESP